jgi:hypothetical protein
MNGGPAVRDLLLADGQTVLDKRMDAFFVTHRTKIYR